MADIVGTPVGEFIEGTADADTIDGLGGGDDLIGLSGNDTLNGGPGNDTLDGGEGDDILNGGPGENDYLPGPGNDTLNGGADHDVIRYGDETGVTGSGVNVNWSAGTATDGFGDTDTFSSIEEILGTRFNDVVDATGIAYRVEMSGGAGNDSLAGGSGDDLLTGDSGNDTLSGGDGEDTALYDYTAADGIAQGVTVNLQAGAATDPFGDTDTLVSIERAIGTHLDDTMTAAGAAFSVYFEGRDGNDTLTGGETDDNLRGGDGNDTLNGGGGNDYLRVEGGDDLVDGGTGDGDVLRLIGNEAEWSISFGQGAAFTMTSAYGTKTVDNVETIRFDDTGNISVDSLRGGATESDDVLGDVNATQSQVISGLDGNDIITGGAGDDELSGDDGDDDVTGGAGNDYLSGGSGDDTLIGGDGSDSLEGGEGDDFLEDLSSDFTNFMPGSGNDTIRGSGEASLNYFDLGFGMRVETATGVATDVATGGSVKTDNFIGINNVDGTDFDDIVIDNSAATDRFFGVVLDAGNDHFDGGTGYDRIDYYFEDGGSGVVVDMAAGTAMDTHGDTDTFTGVEAVYGTEFDDVISGDDGFNDIVGSGGNDTLSGGGGNADRLRYQREEQLEGSTGGINANLQTGVVIDTFGDTDTVDGFEWVVGTSREDTIVAADGVDTFLQGRDGDDALYGGTGNDEIHGEGGADILSGGDGNDVILMDDTGDTVDGGAGRDTARFFADQSELVISDAGGGVLNVGLSTVSNVETFQFQDGILSSNALLSGATTGADTITLNEAGTVDTGSGDDNVTGSGDADQIFTGAGDDTVSAGDGDDAISDAFGDNTLNGGAGSDTVVALSGNNLISGGQDSDFLCGGAGEDILDGGSGNDLIVGDFTSRFGGNDRLIGGTGDDLMAGGKGADTFVFNTNDGSDLIGQLNVDFDDPFNGTTMIGRDFSAGLDVIELTGFGYTDSAQALDFMSTDGGGNAVFSDQGTAITLWGVAATDLTADDFILA